MKTRRNGGGGGGGEGGAGEKTKPRTAGRAGKIGMSHGTTAAAVAKLQKRKPAAGEERSGEGGMGTAFAVKRRPSPPTHPNHAPPSFVSASASASSRRLVRPTTNGAARPKTQRKATTTTPSISSSSTMRGEDATKENRRLLQRQQRLPLTKLKSLHSSTQQPPPLSSSFTSSLSIASTSTQRAMTRRVPLSSSFSSSSSSSATSVRNGTTTTTRTPVSSNLETSSCLPQMKTTTKQNAMNNLSSTIEEKRYREEEEQEEEQEEGEEEEEKCCENEAEDADGEDSKQEESEREEADKMKEENFPGEEENEEEHFQQQINNEDKGGDQEENERVEAVKEREERTNEEKEQESNLMEFQQTEEQSCTNELMREDNKPMNATQRLVLNDLPTKKRSSGVKRSLDVFINDSSSCSSVSSPSSSSSATASTPLLKKQRMKRREAAKAEQRKKEAERQKWWQEEQQRQQAIREREAEQETARQAFERWRQQRRVNELRNTNNSDRRNYLRPIFFNLINNKKQTNRATEEQKENVSEKEIVQTRIERERQRQQRLETIKACSFSLLCRQLSSPSPTSSLPHRRKIRRKVIPCSVSLSEVRLLFEDWRSSLWFAPADFGKSTDEREDAEEVSYELMYVPYCCARATTRTRFSARVRLIPPSSSSLSSSSASCSASEDNNERSMNAIERIFRQVQQRFAQQQQTEKEREEWRDEVATAESVHENVLVCALSAENEEEKELLEHVNEWDVESAKEVTNEIEVNEEVNEMEGDDEDVKALLTLQHVRNAMALSQLRSLLEQILFQKEKESCKQEHLPQHLRYKNNSILSSSSSSSSSSSTLIYDVSHPPKNFRIDELSFSNTSAHFIYVPIWKVLYRYHGRSFRFLVNGSNINAKKLYYGERPWGMGALLGQSVSFLETVFGLKEEENMVGMLDGSSLQKLDENNYNGDNVSTHTTKKRMNCWYREDGQYLLFPPSHSYVVAFAAGYITLRNVGENDLELRAQQRKSQYFGDSYVLRKGETQHFDYKGSWCIEVRKINNDNNHDVNDRTSIVMKATICSDANEAATIRTGLVGMGLELVAVHTTGGGTYGDKLGMCKYYSS